MHLHVHSHSLRAQKVARVLWITLGLNLIVCSAKLIYGYQTQALSMVADGYHSLLDASSNMVGLAALAFAKLQVRWTHCSEEKVQRIHYKTEAIASLFISFLLFLSCYEIASSAYLRIFQHQVPEVTPWSFLIMLGTIAINIFVSTYEHRQGNRLDSQILISDSAHTRSDIYASVSVIVALVAVKLNWIWMDLVAAILIAAVVAYSGYKIILESIEVLRERNPEED